jgi:hypothetical protein
VDQNGNGRGSQAKKEEWIQEGKSHGLQRNFKC